MLKKIIYFTAASFVLFGCSRNIPATSTLSPFEKIFMNEMVEGDVTISVFDGVSMRPGIKESQPSVSVYEKNITKKPFGNVFVNNMEIFFDGYTYCSNPREPIKDMAGKNANFALESSDKKVMPNFSVNRYVPQIIDATITSAVGNIGNEIVDGSPIEISMLPDYNLPEGSKMLVVITGDPMRDDIKTLEYSIQEIPVKTEKYSIPYEEYKKFGDIIEVWFFRGYYQLENINGKSLATLFVQQTYDRLHIK